MKYIETDRLLLRKLSFQDADRIEELAGDYDVAKTTLTIPHPYPKGSAHEFIEKVTEAEAVGKLIIFAIVEKSSESVIGIINISLNTAFQRGELAYWIGKPFWGKGYGTEAARVMLQYGFSELKLNRVFAASFTNNPGSWRIMEKIGLKYEGTLKEHAVRFGKFHDLSYYGVLREDFIRDLAKETLRARS